MRWYWAEACSPPGTRSCTMRWSTGSRPPRRRRRSASSPTLRWPARPCSPWTRSRRTRRRWNGPCERPSGARPRADAYPANVGSVAPIPGIVPVVGVGSGLVAGTVPPFGRPSTAPLGADDPGEGGALEPVDDGCGEVTATGRPGWTGLPDEFSSRTAPTAARTTTSAAAPRSAAISRRPRRRSGAGSTSEGSGTNGSAGTGTAAAARTPGDTGATVGTGAVPGGGSTPIGRSEPLPPGLSPLTGDTGASADRPAPVTGAVSSAARGHHVTMSALTAGRGASPSSAAWRPRSRLASVPVDGRAAGSSARQSRITGHTHSGNPAGRTGTQLACRYSTSGTPPPRYGDRPHSSSYSTMPRAYTSLAGLGGPPAITSGATYSGVAWVTRPASPGETRRATPKSVRRTALPSTGTRMLPGLTSPCTMPCPCT